MFQFFFKNIFKNIKGLNTIENILLGIMILIVFMAVVISFDPIRRVHEMRNSERFSEISKIVGTIEKYKVENSEDMPDFVNQLQTGKLYHIGSCTEKASENCPAKKTESFCLDINSFLTVVLDSVPVDPSIGSLEYTGYFFIKASDRDYAVGACLSEGEGKGGTGNGPDILISGEKN